MRDSHRIMSCMLHAILVILSNAMVFSCPAFCNLLATGLIRVNLHKVLMLQNSVVKAVEVCLKSCSLLYIFCKVNKVMHIDLTIDLSSLLNPQTPAFIHSCCNTSLNNAGLPGFLRCWSSGIWKLSSVSVHPADCLRIVIFASLYFFMN